MTYKELVDRVAASTGLPKAAVRRVLAATSAEVRSALMGGDTAAIAGLGRFDVLQRPARAIRSVTDSRKLLVGPRHSARFRASGAMRDAVAHLDDPTWSSPEVQTAWRTAETLVGDLALYHGAQAPQSLDEDAPDEVVLNVCSKAFGPMWGQVERTFSERVDAAVRERKDLLASAARRRFASA